ncbi:organic hydroperoxide resistance protein [Nitratireductor sp. ZSWI3]|uniref:organic hydroperoxide resistance protein n=1 Tax=Nitratireductor sp. ZSWI3 TaxID=2966359 RepID=UPI00215014E0|nr:organic hydroperoxide resistance protein [Nitratireductor sp. ZSWI3]MCR4265036.1 organic hydroperoxide resistance protein [Nitratireductor sp. ZSWI3]
MQKVYSTTVQAAGGRRGSVASSDGVLQLDLAAPKELGGAGGATNPEQLFAAGYAACFESALRFVARHADIQFSSLSVASTVDLLRSETSDFTLSVEIEVIIDGLDRETAEDLVSHAHATCPYSKAVRGNVPVGIRVNGDRLSP